MQAVSIFKLKKAIIVWMTISLSIFIFQSRCFSLTQTNSISLAEAEHLAISIAPELRQLQANADALQEQAIADGQLSDPQLVLGAINVPTNSFSFSQDEMTMVQVGLQQSFPAGHSLAMKSRKTKSLAKVQQQRIQEQAGMLLRNVRETWLDLYYWNQAAMIIHENRSLYSRLLKATESQYSSGKGTESDVLQLQVELSRLNDQSAQVEQKIDILKAQLGRWIGDREAKRALFNTLPHWPNPIALNVLQARLLQHPLLRADIANIQAACDEVAFAKEQYKPAWMLDVDYGFRQGNMPDGSKRSNMVTAQVTVDLPVFPSQRQNRRLRASANQLESTKLDRDIHYKDLLKELTAQYAIWESFTKRENLYRQQLTPEAIQNSKAALLAYQNATSDLTTVLRAYSNQLTIRLEQIQIQVERAKARAALLYLEGDI